MQIQLAKIEELIGQSLSENGYKGPVEAATTANITLSGEQTIDGVAVVAGEPVLVKNQTSGINNGIWICDSDAWYRSGVMAVGSSAAGAAVYVTKGIANGDKVFICSNDIGSDIVGTDSLTFGALVTSPAGSDTHVQFNDGGVMSGEAGLSYNKTTDALTAGALIGLTGLTVTSGGAIISGNSSITGSLSASTTITAGTGLTVTTGGATITGATAVTGAISATTTVTGGTGVIATTGGVTATAGGLTVSAGGATITGATAVTGAISATTTVTAGTGLTVTTGGATITGATAVTGAISATTTVTGGTGVIATTGGLTVSAGGATITGATAVTGALSATTTVTAGTGLTVTAGNATITDGDVVISGTDNGLTLAKGTTVTIANFAAAAATVTARQGTITITDATLAGDAVGTIVVTATGLATATSLIMTGIQERNATDGGPVVQVTARGANTFTIVVKNADEGTGMSGFMVLGYAIF